MTAQQQAAYDAMEQWLTDQRELGEPPETMECAGTFYLDGMRYYIFRYRVASGEPWLLGVCGGYSGEETEHCGHVFSDMTLFDPEFAESDATALVEQIRACWEQAGSQTAQAMTEEEPVLSEPQAEQEPDGTFSGVILLSSCEWSPGQIRDALWEDWGLTVSSAQEGGDGNSAVWDIDGMIAAVCLLQAPVPHGEAERYAAFHPGWPEARQAARAHKAHLRVAVLAGTAPVRTAGELFVKVCCAALRQQNSLGLYALGTVFAPEEYQRTAGVLRDGGLPVHNLVFAGCYEGEEGSCGYTNGLRAFGKPELEVLGSAAGQPELQEFLYAAAGYVISEDVLLQEGETIGFNEQERFSITLSEGVAVQGKSLKLSFMTIV